jgi:pimeloyl-ACP methyl ester carboxylesterase
MEVQALAHEVLSAEGAEPSRNALLIHGILGWHGNWKSFARRLIEAHPAWQVVLADLRGHGGSPAGAGPHTVEACAEDLLALGRQLGLEPELICGHSFGGKVALSYAARAAGRGVRQVWVLDAPPGPRTRAKSDPMEQSAADVIVALRQVPLPVKSRKELIDRLLALGLSRPIALWMTTNLSGGAEGLRWKFDLDAVEQMLASYLAADLWPVLEAPAAGMRIDLVRAERSAGWSEADLERLARLGSGGQVRLHVLPDSGHWVHVDNPEGLFRLLAPSFASSV